MKIQTSGFQMIIHFYTVGINYYLADNFSEIVDLS